MIRALIPLVLVFAAAAAARPAPAQVAGDTADFLDAAVEAARRYRDQRVAVAEGYRRVGPDFPAMGEHWVQPGRLVSGRFDPAAPAILSYVPVAGGRVLAGVAYALPLGPDEVVPAFPREGAWHDHSESVNEESLLVAPHLARAGTRGPRLAMLHVWTELPNPEGVFAQHNWTLPFARAGLRPEVTPPEAAARALSLLRGGEEYYRAVVVAVCAPDPATDARVAAALQDAGTRAADAVEGADTLVDLARLEALAAAWNGLLVDLAGLLPPHDWERLRPMLHPAHRDGH